jgi:hypothetical protein
MSTCWLLAVDVYRLPLSFIDVQTRTKILPSAAALLLLEKIPFVIMQAKFLEQLNEEHTAKLNGKRL